MKNFVYHHFTATENEGCELYVIATEIGKYSVELLGIEWNEHDGYFYWSVDGIGELEDLKNRDVLKAWMKAHEFEGFSCGCFDTLEELRRDYFELEPNEEDVVAFECLMENMKGE